MIDGFTHLEAKISNTNALIDDVTNAAKEQSIGMTQISDAINQLDSFTQQNAAIADKAKSIAFETSTIASRVVENVDKNSFEGKDTKRKIEEKQDFAQKEEIRKVVKTKVTKKASPIKKEITQKVDTDEWESF